MRSLRGRLTLGILLALGAVLVVAGLAASRQVADSETEAFDDRLERTAELSRATARAAVQEQLPGEDRRLEAVLSATRSSVRLLLGDTVLLDTGYGVPRHRPLPLGFSTFTAGGEPFRAYVTRLRDPDLGGLARLEVVSSLALLRERQRTLDRRLAELFALVMLAAGAATWLAAARVLRPLTRLRAAAVRIAGDADLHRRLPAGAGPSEVRSLSESINAMLARLEASAADRERALQATRRFAADAGHELRTPLTSVNATLSAIARHPDLPAEQRAALAADALAEQRRLVELLDGLQALARGDATAGERRAVDLAELADEVAASLRAHGAAVDARLPDAPVLVDGWPPGLRLMAENLVRNALVHGGGRALLTVEADPPALCVDDAGPGVPAAERERIFEPFARLDGDAPGSGLGLALVAQQARQHAATVSVGDSPLGGARFTVRFPPAR